MSAGYTAVLFDMDGVLIDSEPQHLRATNICLAKEGASLTEDENRVYLGWNEKTYWVALKERFQLKGDVSDYIDERTEALIALLKDELPVAAGLEKTLKELVDRGISLAVASSSERDLIEYVLGETGFSRYFSAIAAGCEVTRSKPDPEIFRLAADRLNQPPETCLVLEDSPHGALAAVAAGMDCVRVRTASTRGLEFPPLKDTIDGFEDLDLDRLLHRRLVT